MGNYLVLIKSNKYDTHEEVKVKQLEFYSTEAGRVPFAEWLDDLDCVTRAKIMAH